MDALFAWRGVLLGALGLGVAAYASPSATSLAGAAGILALGLLLRGWAFATLGPQGRTRDPSPPRGRVEDGPYRWLGHPVYLANTALALGLLVAADLPLAAVASLITLVAGFYLLLARRESVQLSALPRRPASGLSLPAVARSERSTWFSVAGLLLAQLLLAQLLG